MSAGLILLVADDNFLPHAKHVMVNCRRQGCWRGDFALIIPEGTDVSEVEGRGIEIFPVPASGFLTKFYLFDEMLSRWSSVLYLDCDVIVLSDVQPLFQQLAEYEPLENGRRPIIADMEDSPAWMPFERASHGTKERHAMFMELSRQFPCVLDHFWNTAMLLYDPASIPPGTVQRLQALQEKYGLINNPAEGGTDQQIVHIALYDRIRRIKDKLWCFWGLDEPNARVYSENRDWRGDEVPIVLHYGRWYAPWIVKTPDMDAYYNDRLGRVCCDFYVENVIAFDEEFPKL